MRRSTVLGIAMVFATLSVVLLPGPLSLAHNEPKPKPEMPEPEPPPTPTPEPPPIPEAPPPPPRMYIERLTPPRWSWLHWWEANRDAHLDVLQQGPGDQPVDPEQLRACHQRAAKALVDVLEDPKKRPPSVRGAAALALGRMGDVGALPALQAAAKADRQEAVRVSARVALGLLDSSDAEKGLWGLPSQPQTFDREASLCGLGFRSERVANWLTRMRSEVKGPAPARAAMAAWGMRQGGDPANARLLREVIARTTDPWLASEAILALGCQHKNEARPSERDRRLLIAVLLADFGGKDMPALQAMNQRMRKVLVAYELHQKALRSYRAAYRRYVREHQEEFSKKVKAYQEQVKQYEKPHEKYVKEYEAWRRENVKFFEKGSRAYWEAVERSKKNIDWENWRYFEDGKWHGLSKLAVKERFLNNGYFRRYRRKMEKWLQEEVQLVPKWAAPPPPQLPDLEKMQVGKQTTVVIGDALIYRGRLRGSAAIALGSVDHPDARKALLTALAEPGNAYSDLYKGFAIMSLGRIGTERCMKALVNILAGDGSAAALTPRQRLHSPLRGYAALALGLYARTIATPQGPKSRPDATRAMEALADRLGDRNETPEVRCACAVALGLTRRTAVLKLFQGARKALGDASKLVQCYALLGRAMAGDKTIIKPVKKILDESSGGVDPAEILGRRAAVLALGVAGNTAALPILRKAWHQSYYVNRETMLATALLKAYNATDALVKLLRDSTDPLAQEFAARSLGELLARQRPQRLSWLTADSNYMMRNVRMLPFQALANDFLFGYLIPSFGAQWR